MEDDATSQSPTALIDPDGDVELVVSDEKRSMRVSSKVLSCASKVFKAMFSRSYKEGNELAQEGAMLLEIPLPDDNPWAMEAMCNICHFKTRQFNECLGIDKLYALAVISDKYDCAEAVQFTMKPSLDIQIQQCEDKALVTAFLLDNAIAFMDASKYLVLNFNQEAVKSMLKTRLDQEDKLPERFLSMINSEVERALPIVCRAIIKADYNLVDGSLPRSTCGIGDIHGFDDGVSGSYTLGLHDHLIHSFFNYQLRERGLHPAEFTNLAGPNKLNSITQIFDSLLEMAEEDPGDWSRNERH